MRLSLPTLSCSPRPTADPTVSHFNQFANHAPKRRRTTPCIASRIVACGACRRAAAGNPLSDKTTVRPPSSLILQTRTHPLIPPALALPESSYDQIEEIKDSKESEKGGDEGFSVGVRVALKMLGAYKAVISPVLPPACRYLPTCSVYATEAYKKYGVGKGTVLTAWRLLRCNPWGGSMYDPVRWPPPGLEFLEAKR